MGINLEKLENSPLDLDQDLIGLAYLEGSTALEEEDLQSDDCENQAFQNQLRQSASRLYPGRPLQTHDQVLELARERVAIARSRTELKEKIYKDHPSFFKEMSRFYRKHNIPLTGFIDFHKTELARAFQRDPKKYWDALRSFIVVDIAHKKGVLSDSEYEIAAEGLANNEIDVLRVSFKDISRVEEILRGKLPKTELARFSASGAVYSQGKILINADRFPYEKGKGRLFTSDLSPTIAHEMYHFIQYRRVDQLTTGDKEMMGRTIESAYSISLDEAECDSKESCEELWRKTAEANEGREKWKWGTFVQRSQTWRSPAMSKVFFDLVRLQSEDKKGFLLGWAYLHDRTLHAQVAQSYINTYEHIVFFNQLIFAAASVDIYIREMRATYQGGAWDPFVDRLLAAYENSKPFTPSNEADRKAARMLRNSKFNPDYPSMRNDSSKRKSYIESLLFVAFIKGERNESEGVRYFEEVLLPALQIQVNWH